MTTIRLRRGTAAQWTAANPVLALGEPGFETDTNKLKAGDGTTAWNSLPYFSGGSGGGVDSVNGRTGAVTLTQADVGLNGLRTVVDFGADPTGVANSTSAFIAANAAGLNVILPQQVTPGTPNQFRLADWTPLDGTVVTSVGPTGYLSPYYTSNILVKHASASDAIIKTNGKKSITFQGFHIKGVDRTLPLIEGGGDNITLRDITGYEGYCGYGKIDGTGITMQTSYVENCFFGNNQFGLRGLIDTTVVGGALFANKTAGLYLGAGNSFNNINTRIEFNGQGGGTYSDGFNVEIYQADDNYIGGTIDAGYLGGISMIEAERTMVNALLRRNGRKDGGSNFEDCHVFLQDCDNIVMTLMTKAQLGDGGASPTTPKYSIWLNNTDPGRNSNITVFGDLSGNTVQDIIQSGTLDAVNFNVVATGSPLSVSNFTTTDIGLIDRPQPGMLVYDSTVNGLSYYNGTSWVDISGGSYFP